MGENETSAIRRFLPFPEDQGSPEGWPTEYVDAQDYDELRRAASEVRGFWGIEDAEGYREAMSYLALVLDRVREPV